MKSRIPILALICVVLSVSCLPRAETEGITAAQTALEQIDIAKGTLIEAYNEVLSAEEAGADVLSLTENLTMAGTSLTDAFRLFNEGNYSEAMASAEKCSDIAANVRLQVPSIRDNALLRAQWSIPIKTLGWILSIVIICAVTFVGWEAFKDRHYRRLLKKHVRVVSNES